MNMIPDIESEVFTGVLNTVLAFDQEVMCGGVQDHFPESLPFVSVYESSNIVDENYTTGCNIENRALIQYQVDVYTNDVNGKAFRAKKLAGVVAGYFNSIGFYRTFAGPVPNFPNPDVYRYTMRFDATVDRRVETARR